MGGDSCSKGRGFESQHRILDGDFSHIFVVRIVMFVWKDENKLNRGLERPFLKNNYVCWSLWVVFSFHFKLETAQSGHLFWGLGKSFPKNCERKKWRKRMKCSWQWLDRSKKSFFLHQNMKRFRWSHTAWPDWATWERSRW